MSVSEIINFISLLYGHQNVYRDSDCVFTIKMSKPIKLYFNDKGIVCRLYDREQMLMEDIINAIANKDETIMLALHLCDANKSYNIFSEKTVFTGIWITSCRSSVTSFGHLNTTLKKKWNCVKGKIIKKYMLLLSEIQWADVALKITHEIYLLGCYN